MDISKEGWVLIISIASMAGAIVSGIYAAISNSTAKAAIKISMQALETQVLMPLLVEYKSAEMLIAIRSLWAFARANPGNVEEAFRVQRDKDYIAMQQIEKPKQTDYLRTTIDHHRRMVSQFYGMLTSASEKGTVQK